jgi:hypothetical protein
VSAAGPSSLLQHDTDVVERLLDLRFEASGNLPVLVFTRLARDAQGALDQDPGAEVAPGARCRRGARSASARRTRSRPPSWRTTAAVHLYQCGFCMCCSLKTDSNQARPRHVEARAVPTWASVSSDRQPQASRNLTGRGPRRSPFVASGSRQTPVRRRRLQNGAQRRCESLVARACDMHEIDSEHLLSEPPRTSIRTQSRGNLSLVCDQSNPPFDFLSLRVATAAARRSRSSVTSLWAT